VVVVAPPTPNTSLYNSVVGWTELCRKYEVTWVQLNWNVHLGSSWDLSYDTGHFWWFNFCVKHIIRFGITFCFLQHCIPVKSNTRTCNTLGLLAVWLLAHLFFLGLMWCLDVQVTKYTQPILLCKNNMHSLFWSCLFCSVKQMLGDLMVQNSEEASLRCGWAHRRGVLRCIDDAWESNCHEVRFSVIN
jgi:hypothetical protein